MKDILVSCIFFLSILQYSIWKENNICYLKWHIRWFQPIWKFVQCTLVPELWVSTSDVKRWVRGMRKKGKWLHRWGLCVEVHLTWNGSYAGPGHGTLGGCNADRGTSHPPMVTRNTPDLRKQKLQSLLTLGPLMTLLASPSFTKVPVICSVGPII